MTETMKKWKQVISSSKYDSSNCTDTCVGHVTLICLAPGELNLRSYQPVFVYISTDLDGLVRARSDGCFGHVTISFLGIAEEDFDSTPAARPLPSESPAHIRAL